MQQKETSNDDALLDVFSVPGNGRVVALDPGTKKLGVAVSDELQITARALRTIPRTSWKKLLTDVKEILAEFDAVGLVIGLPFNFDGSESEMSQEARRIARNFSLSLEIPVVLQDERVTTYEARARLWSQGVDDEAEMRSRLDNEAAVVILGDFLSRR